MRLSERASEYALNFAIETLRAAYDPVYAKTVEAKALLPLAEKAWELLTEAGSPWIERASTIFANFHFGEGHWHFEHDGEVAVSRDGQVLDFCVEGLPRLETQVAQAIHIPSDRAYHVDFHDEEFDRDF